MVNEPELPKVLGYEQILWVREEDGGVIQVMVRLDDWYSDVEIYKKLVEAYPGKTVGEVVMAIKAARGDSPTVGNGVISACIKRTGLLYPDPSVVRDWNDAV